MNAMPGTLVVTPRRSRPASIRAIRATRSICDKRPATTQPAAPAPITT
jgi:hypothetical protein